MEKSVLFSTLDWIVLFGYLVLTTWVGHRMRGKQATIRDFFLGGKSLPWPAVSGSIIATEISGVTFIGVPGMIFALHGNFTYLQWALGSIIGRILVAIFFVKVYYKREIYSPYDYMGGQLGKGAKSLATILFFLGAILGQSVRVLVAALPLRVVTGLPIEWCIVIIGLFAVGWTLMGGMRTVIWTDVMQFCLFIFGGLLAFFWIIFSLDGGFSEFWTTAQKYGRTRLLDTSWQGDLEFTLWVALLVGAALFVHYNKNPFTTNEGKILYEKQIKTAKQNYLSKTNTNGTQISPRELQNIENSEAQRLLSEAPRCENPNTKIQSHVPKPGTPDYVFPLWITTVLPIGLRGLILAGVFAAAISSLDSILAALSQTTLSLIYHPEEKKDEELEKMNLVAKSRILVIFWGLLLTGFTFFLLAVQEKILILSLAFGMTSYTVGPMLGIFFCALIGKASIRGLSIGVALSLLIVLFIRIDVWVLAYSRGLDITWLAKLFTYDLIENAKGFPLKPKFTSAWAWPLTTILTFLCGYFIRKKSKTNQ